VRRVKVGEATRHARECGGGTGVALLLRTNAVLLLRAEHSAEYPSPYVDVHGEPGHGGGGGQLFLAPQRYSALNALYASHRVGREVARARNGAYAVNRAGVF
jgi:hypothetical protein